MPTRPGLPGGQQFVRNQFVQAGEEAGLGVDHGGQLILGQAHAQQHGVPVQVGDLPGELGERHGVVHLGQVTHGDLVPVVGSNARLEVQHGLSLLCGVIEARERKHLLHVGHILLTDLLVLVLAVVLLVR